MSLEVRVVVVLDRGGRGVRTVTVKERAAQKPVGLVMFHDLGVWYDKGAFSL